MAYLKVRHQKHDYADVKNGFHRLYAKHLKRLVSLHPRKNGERCNLGSVYIEGSANGAWILHSPNERELRKATDT